MARDPAIYKPNPRDAALRAPNDTHRTMIIGTTGSGKTQAAAHLLSGRSFHRMPWIIIDFKRERLFEAIRGLEEIGIDDKIPKHKGLYIVRPMPEVDRARVDALLLRAHAKENVGFYIDEGLQIATSKRPSAAYTTLLTQGRSMHIPLITLSQRPVELPRFAFSESEFVMCFQLNDNRDIKTVQEFAKIPLEEDLPGHYWAWWWDNTQKARWKMPPVPSKDTILERFYERLRQPRRVI